jgi:hypothetical protein
MDEVIDAIKQLLDTAKAVPDSRLSAIKNIFNGEPMRIPSSCLPCVTIEQATSPVSYRGTDYMEYDHTVHIRLIMDPAASVDPKEDSTEFQTVQISQTQRRIVAATTGRQVDADSIVGVLLNNPTLPLDGNRTCDVALVQNINYNADKDRPYRTKEALITVVCKSAARRMT